MLLLNRSRGKQGCPFLKSTSSALIKLMKIVEGHTLRNSYRGDSGFDVFLGCFGFVRIQVELFRI
jgi:hypothetical protein